jgi:hypothetical protein
MIRIFGVVSAKPLKLLEGRFDIMSLTGSKVAEAA